MGARRRRLRPRLGPVLPSAPGGRTTFVRGGPRGLWVTCLQRRARRLLIDVATARAGAVRTGGEAPPERNASARVTARRRTVCGTSAEVCVGVPASRRENMPFCSGIALFVEVSHLRKPAKHRASPFRAWPDALGRPAVSAAVRFPASTRATAGSRAPSRRSLSGGKGPRLARTARRTPALRERFAVSVCPVATALLTDRAPAFRPGAAPERRATVSQARHGGRHRLRSRVSTCPQGGASWDRCASDPSPPESC